MLAVELELFENPPLGGCGACDHVCELTGNREQATAVVAEVDDEIDNAFCAELLDRLEKAVLCGLYVRIKGEVAYRAGRGIDRFHGLNRDGGDLGARQRNPYDVPTTTWHHADLMGISERDAEKRVVYDIDFLLGRCVDDVNTVRLDDRVTTLEPSECSRGTGLDQHNAYLPRHPALQHREIHAVTGLDATLREGEELVRVSGEMELVLGRAGRRGLERLHRIEVLGRRQTFRVDVHDLVEP